MKIKSIKIENFRGYKNEVCVDFDTFTAFVGRNDVGKSTVMEALDIFFYDGKGLIKLDKDDINKEGKKEGKNDVKISVCFTELPSTVIIDESNETTLQSEYLLNSQGDLEIIKLYKNAATTASGIKVSIKASHPTNKACADLLLKKQSALLEILDKNNLTCSDRRKNAEVRSAIWNYFNKTNDLQLTEIEIDVNSKEGDIKALWGKLQSYMPYYSLFQSDRKNSDGDNEIQDPLKEAVKQIINDSDLQEKLDYVANKVREKLQEVSDLTLSKIKEMNEDIANSLHPKVPMTQDLKWSDVFKGLSITGDEDIPINKRGSGVKRLILLNFFRAEAERRQREANNQHIIYAIEEPETSQHKHHQKMLIDALKTLAATNGVQIIITTHSSDIVKQLKFSQLKLIRNTDTGKTIENVAKNSLPYPSLNEVNYLAFGDVTEEYHNELYGFLQSKATNEDSKNEKEKHFETWLVSKGCVKSMQWIRQIQGVAQPAIQMTPQTYIRNYIHHPENQNNAKYTNEQLKNSIDMMKTIAQTYI
jgi:predicted ATP-dependent endonuclease of OLD family